MVERYTVKQFNNNVYIIRENYCEDFCITLGLVIGTEKAFLIDAGMGVYGGELKGVVESLTDLPVSVLCTHGHPDHIAGAVLFRDIYMNDRDDDQLPRLDNERRLGDIPMFSHDDAEVIAYAREHCIDIPEFRYTSIDDGDVLDAGGVKLKVLAVPGHSKGSLVFFNEEENYAFSGDAIGYSIPASSYKSREAFLENAAAAERFMNAINDDTVLIGGHWKEPVPHDVLSDIMNCFREIGEGKTENDEDVYLPISPVPNQKRHKYGMVAISYNPVINS